MSDRGLRLYYTYGPHYYRSSTESSRYQEEHLERGYQLNAYRNREPQEYNYLPGIRSSAANIPAPSPGGWGEGWIRRSNGVYYRQQRREY